MLQKLSFLRFHLIFFKELILQIGLKSILIKLITHRKSLKVLYVDYCQQLDGDDLTMI
jgi:hypothetical protein